MADNFNSEPSHSRELLTPEGLLNAIGDRFIEADLATDADPSNIYIGADRDLITQTPLNVIYLAESHDQFAHNKGEVLHLIIPNAYPTDIWDGIEALDSDNPNRYAIILQLHGSSNTAFKIDGAQVKPYRDLPKFGKHTFLVPRTYLADTIPKVKNYVLVPIKPRMTPDAPGPGIS